MRRVLLIGAAVIAALLLCLAVIVQTACAPDNSQHLPGAVTSSGPAAQSSTTSTAAAASTSATASGAAAQPTVDITIAAVGDVMVHTATRLSAWNLGNGVAYDFKPMFAAIAPYLRRADYTVCNLETRMAGGGLPYTGYPRFNAPDELADALAYAGVDLCATANNHSADKGWPGIVNTLKRLDAVGIAHIGTYRNPKDKAVPFIADIKGIKVAFINYTDYLNERTPPAAWTVNFLKDPRQVAADAQAARKAGADIIIAFLHWGREWAILPNDEQTSYALGSRRYPGLLAEGVDVILGAHPHVPQDAIGIRREYASGSRNKYVVYSMGNFLSDMTTPHADSGVIVYVNIRKTGERVEVTGLRYMGVYMQQSGGYPPKLVIEPLLPGVEPAPGYPIGVTLQRHLDSIWGYITRRYYHPDMNILPFDPSERP